MDLEDVLLWDQLEQDLENAVEEAAVNRLVLNHINPLQLNENKFMKLFRLSKPLARQLIEIVTPFLRQQSRRSALSVETKVGKYVLHFITKFRLWVDIDH